MYVVWFEECSWNISALYGLSVTWNGLLLSLHRWHPHCQQHTLQEHKEHLCIVLQHFLAVWNPYWPTQVRARHLGAAVFGALHQSTWQVTTPRPSAGDQRFSSSQHLTSTENIPGPGELLPQVHSQVCCYPDTPKLTAEQGRMEGGFLGFQEIPFDSKTISIIT